MPPCSRTMPADWWCGASATMHQRPTNWSRRSPLLRTDLDTVLFGGALDPPLDRFHFILVILRGVIFVVNVAPRRADVFLGVNRILLVGRVGVFHITVLVLALFRADIF